MQVMASSLFHVIHFPHQGKIVIVNQLSFFASSSSDGNVPYVKHIGAPYESLGVGLFKDFSLMENFPLPPPHVASVNMISVKSDPWVIPSLDLVDTWGEVMPLSLAEVNYMEIVSALGSASSDSLMSKTSLDTYSQSLWLGTLESPDPLAETFLADEGIMEVMSLMEPPWIDIHHRSSFLPCLVVMSTVFEESSYPFPPPIVTHEVWSEGNLGNITQTMSIDISIRPGIVEHVHIRVSCSPDEIKTYTRLFQEFCDVFAWSYDEMPSIDPNIVVHEIPTYLHAKPVRQQLLPIHLRKATTIKGEVENLLKVGFVYPIHLTN